MTISFRNHVRAWGHHAVLNVAFAFYNFKKRRWWEAAKAVFFTFPPPQWHHEEADIADLAKRSAGDWFRFGIAEE